MQKMNETERTKTLSPTKEFPNVLEISDTEVLEISNCSIILKRVSEESYEFKFDGFSYIQLLRCLRDLCLFTTAPTSIQFEAIARFHKRGREQNIAKEDFENQSHTLNCALDFAVNQKTLTNHESFLVRQFLVLNLPLLYAYTEFNRLIGE